MLSPSARGEAPAAESVVQAEQARIRVIERAAPAVVCVYDSARHGGGSGVIIGADGYGLTNFHVVAGMLDTRRGLGGLSDGKLYELQVLGIDPTGDVAMFRLLGETTEPTPAAIAADDPFKHPPPAPAAPIPPPAPPSGAAARAFPFAELGDSDAMKVGDFALAMGNPFALSEDQTPTVTMGIITGVHRYQWGAGGNTLLYSDCLQTDAPINPGNSGGPLFDMQGRVIGINGRISVGQRGRYNVGFGYAISINQIKRFIPSLRAGLLAQHGLLQATVNQELAFNDLLENAPGWKIGIRPGDRLLRFGGQEIKSANELASLLGTYPADWPVPVSFEHEGKVLHRVARLEALRLKLPKPFEPDAQVNRRAAARLIEQFRSATFGTATDAARALDPSRWSVESNRVPLGEGDAVPSRSERREMAIPSDGAATQTISDADGNALRRVEFTDSSAEWISGGDRYQAPLEDALAYRAAYALFHALLGSGPVEPERATHGGGDELVRLAADGALLECTLLETLRLKLGEHASASYQFGADDHWLRRIVVRDQPTGFVVTLTFGDVREWSGLRFPTVVEAESEKGTFREVLTDIHREGG